jgi:hypothetical protein
MPSHTHQRPGLRRAVEQATDANEYAVGDCSGADARIYLLVTTRATTMSRRKAEITARINERDYPHLVELALPPGGFRSRSDAMLGVVVVPVVEPKDKIAPSVESKKESAVVRSWIRRPSTSPDFR